MVVTRVPRVSFVELKCFKMSRVAEALIVEAIGLVEEVRQCKTLIIPYPRG
jgi:hypothetical protein